MNITVHHTPSFYKLSMTIFSEARGVARQNNQVNSNEQFRRKIVHHPRLEEDSKFALSNGSIRHPKEVEIVLFGCKWGVTERVDKLDPTRYGEKTLVLPVILPFGRSVLTVDGQSINLERGIGYLFNHSLPHSLKLEDTRSGCALLMISEVK